MADSTRSMRKVILDRDIRPAFESRLLKEITPDDLRALCAKVKDRGAPATAVIARDIVKQIYTFANLHADGRGAARRRQVGHPGARAAQAEQAG